MIPNRDNPDSPLASAVATACPTTAMPGSDGDFSPACHAGTEVPQFPLTDFVFEKPDFSFSAKVMAMKAAGWLAIGLDRLFGSRSRGRTGILTYHRLSPPIRGLPPPTHNVTPDQFRGHVAGLLDRGFTVWPLRELLRYSALGKPLPPRTIALTFDDGFQTVYTDAWPILREYRLPATLCLTTAYLGSSGPFPFDTWGREHRESLPPKCYRSLTVEQCREMAESGLIDVAAHTHTHRDLRGRPEEFREDLQISVDFLRATFGLSDVMFAFPYGARHAGFAGPELVAAAKRVGVNCGLTTDCSLNASGSDPFAWGRFNVFSWDDAATLAAKLDGWYTWAAHSKRAVARLLRGRRRIRTRAED